MSMYEYPSREIRCVICDEVTKKYLGESTAIIITERTLCDECKSRLQKLLYPEKYSQENTGIMTHHE